MFEVVSQVVIGGLGLATIFLVTSQEEAVRRLAPPLGLLAQPFWYWTSYSNEQWGILVLSLLYTFRWAQIAHRDLRRNT